jgi:hypothetical protein
MTARTERLIRRPFFAQPDAFEMSPAGNGGSGAAQLPAERAIWLGSQ